MAALEHEVQCRCGQLLLDQIRGFGLIDGEELLEPFRVRPLEIELALTFLEGQPDVAIAARGIPAQIPDAFHVLQVHRQPLEAVGDFDRHRFAVDAAALLEIGELGDLHAIQPHLPPHTPGPEGGGFPVVLDETNVVIGRLNAKGLQGGEVGLLNAIGRWLDQHLVLEVVLGAVGVIAVAAVGGTSAGLRVGHGPGFRTDGPQHRVRTHGARPLFRVIGLQQQAALVSPEAVEGADDVLEVHCQPRACLRILPKG